MDDRLQAFLDVVDCEPSDVREAGDFPHRKAVDQIGGDIIHFGKHKGERIDEVPRAYLLWLVNAPRKKKYRSLRKFKARIREYLALTLDKIGDKPEQTGPVDEEFQRFVRSF